MPIYPKRRMPCFSARHDGSDVPFLARVALQEFEAGGRVVKEIFDGDDGPLRAACRGDLAENASLHGERICFLPLDAGEDGRLGNGGNGGNGLAAEAEREDGGKVIRRL